MEKKTLAAKSPLGKLRDLFAKNSLYSTIFALIVMVLIQAVVQAANNGIFGMFGGLGRA